MTATSNWSFNTFEDVAKLLAPSVKWYIMDSIEIIPVSYSDWSDNIYVKVDVKINEQGKSIIYGLEDKNFEYILNRISCDITRLFLQLLNTNVMVSEWDGELKRRRSLYAI